MLTHKQVWLVPIFILKTENFQNNFMTAHLWSNKKIDKMNEFIVFYRDKYD